MKKLLNYCGIIAIILLIPSISSQFSREVNWQLFDYLVAALLLTILFVGIEVIKKLKSKKRYFVLAFFLIIMILIWIELAVGIFNSPISGT
jgi:hypothetical protein